VSVLLYARTAYIVNTLRGNNGLHAFGSNSAEGEPIWMKSGTMPRSIDMALVRPSERYIEEKQTED